MKPNFDVATFGTSLRQQIWLIAVSARWLYPLAGLAVLLMLTVLSGWSYSVVAGVLAVVAGAIWPSMLWYGETPSRRTYHWSLPVSRPGHDLMRVLAGSLFLIGICAALGVLGAIGDGTLEFFSAGGARAWGGFFVAPLAAYLLMMPIALWSDYPITRRSLSAFVVFTMLALTCDAFGFHGFIRIIELALADGRWSFANTLTDGVSAMYLRGAALADEQADWLLGVALWMGVGAVGTLLTAFNRPDDIRRRFSAPRATTPVRSA